jgi:uncharacterized protein (TIGR00369 family)
MSWAAGAAMVARVPVSRCSHRNRDGLDVRVSTLRSDGATRGMSVTSFPIRNEGYAERVRQSFARQGFMASLGASLTDVAPGRVEIAVPFDAGLAQQHGYFHGGVVGTVADNAGGYASFTLMAASDSVLTVEYKLNLMAPSDGETLIARGTVIRPGRRLTVSRADVFVKRDGVEYLCATMVGTFMTLENTSDDPSRQDQSSRG